jgi:hypothetical protein
MDETAGGERAAGRHTTTGYTNGRHGRQNLQSKPGTWQGAEDFPYSIKSHPPDSTDAARIAGALAYRDAKALWCQAPSSRYMLFLGEFRVSS